MYVLLKEKKLLLFTTLIKYHLSLQKMAIQKPKVKNVQIASKNFKSSRCTMVSTFIRVDGRGKNYQSQIGKKKKKKNIISCSCCLNETKKFVYSGTIFRVFFLFLAY